MRKGSDTNVSVLTEGSEKTARAGPVSKRRNLPGKVWGRGTMGGREGEEAHT